MPVTLNCGFERINSTLRIVSLNCGEDSLLAWWYCGLEKNQRDNSHPWVWVAFRIQIADNKFSDRTIIRKIPISSLRDVPIGSLCKGNRVIAYAKFETREFGLAHKTDQWRFTSFYDAARNNRELPYPQEIHPLAYERDRNYLIQFKTVYGEKLLTPCLEYFARCYGDSGELRRILTTYPWEGPGGCMDRFFAPLDVPEEPTVWKVKFRKKMHNGDAVFLAHAKYDPYTRKVAKQIYSEIDVEYSKILNSFNSDKKVHMFPRIGPWYEGYARLLVGGIPFDNGNSFLGLRIYKISEPTGVDIERSRENRNNALQPAGPDSPGNAWAGAPAKQKNHLPEIIDLTADEAPDQGASTMEISTFPVGFLGTRRIVRDFKDDQAKNSAGPPGPIMDNNVFSAGEPQGSGKDIGYAAFKDETIIESDGVLLDVWNALFHIANTYSDVIKSVEWYIPSKGFIEGNAPQLVAFEPFEKNEIDRGEISSGVLRWPFLNFDTLERRGLLVARLNIYEKFVYFIEIQRRLISHKEDNGKVTYDEENYCGLVFMLDDDNEFEEWLQFFKSNIRRKKGVVKKLTAYCPGIADFYQHRTNSKDRVLYSSAIEIALNKMNIEL